MLSDALTRTVLRPGRLLVTSPRTVCLLSAMLVAGCSTIEGTYSPNCAAYEGDRITLDGGQFVWDRFTDTVPVDEDGEPVDPTPGYPKSGSYSETGNLLAFETEAGEALGPLYAHRQEGLAYLLTGDQRDVFEESGRLPECALVLEGAGQQ